MIAGKNFACRRSYSRVNGFHHHHPLLPPPFLRDQEYCTDNEVCIVYIHSHCLYQVSINDGVKSCPRCLTWVNVETLLVHVMTTMTTASKPTCGNQVRAQVPEPRVPREVAECQQSLHQTRDLGDPACLTGTPYIYNNRHHSSHSHLIRYIGISHQAML